MEGNIPWEGSVGLYKKVSSVWTHKKVSKRLTSIVYSFWVSALTSVNDELWPRSINQVKPSPNCLWAECFIPAIKKVTNTHDNRFNYDTFEHVCNVFQSYSSPLPFPVPSLADSFPHSKCFWGHQKILQHLYKLVKYVKSADVFSILFSSLVTHKSNYLCPIEITSLLTTMKL